jgi:threonine/homoserine/homoserine lactone efflux protein
MPELSLDPVTLAAFVATTIVLALTPGPDMILYLGKAIGQSRTAGAVTFAGAASGILVHTMLAALGLSALLMASAAAFTAIKIAGAAYLIYLAYDAIRHGSSFNLEAGAGGHERYSVLYSKGLLVNLLNPKIVIFFLTLLPQFVAADDPNAALTMALLGVGFILIAAPICLAQILAAGWLAGFLKRSRWAMRAVDFTFAGVMGFFAVRLVLAEGK